MPGVLLHLIVITLDFSILPMGEEQHDGSERGIARAIYEPSTRPPIAVRTTVRGGVRDA